MYLLDTNAVIAALNGNDRILSRLKSLSTPDVAVSSIVIHELYYGAFKSRRLEENLRRVDSLQFQLLEFDREDARYAGSIRAQLTVSGNPIGPYDVLIAGQALSRSLILVTRNGREFARVDGLVIEDWESAT